MIWFFINMRGIVPVPKSSNVSWRINLLQCCRNISRERWKHWNNRDHMWQDTSWKWSFRNIQSCKDMYGSSVLLLWKSKSDMVLKRDHFNSHYRAEYHLESFLALASEIISVSAKPIVYPTNFVITAHPTWNTTYTTIKNNNRKNT